MKHSLLFLHAQTAIHAGTGATDSVVDLPVQREAHSGYPCIFGSSVKGALRAKAEAQQAAATAVLFGAKGSTDNIAGNAGSLLISDARILLLPVRSLTGAFRWVTCPAVLSRFKQDAARFKANLNFPIPQVAIDHVICRDEQPTLYLEEYRLTVSHFDGLDAIIDALAPALNYDNSTDMLGAQIAIISDDNFAYMAKYTLPVDAHIAIDSDTKIVQQGALWYEETLPCDSVLYIGVAAAESRQRNEKDAEGASKFKTDADVLNDFKNLFDAGDPWLQIGGNETVGMGWCHVRFLAEQGD